MEAFDSNSDHSASFCTCLSEAFVCEEIVRLPMLSISFKEINLFLTGNAYAEDDDGRLFYVAGRINERPVVTDDDKPLMTRLYFSVLSCNFKSLVCLTIPRVYQCNCSSWESAMENWN